MEKELTKKVTVYDVCGTEANGGFELDVTHNTINDDYYCPVDLCYDCMNIYADMVVDALGNLVDSRWNMDGASDEAKQEVINTIKAKKEHTLDSKYTNQ